MLENLTFTAVIIKEFFMPVFRDFQTQTWFRTKGFFGLEE